MKRLSCAVVSFAVALLFMPQVPVVGIGEAFAVKPPSDEVRTEAEKGHEKKKKEKGREIKASGCPYGKDKTTGKCYKPREGQFYEDSQGNVHVKETKCVNLPWKPCGGSTPAPAKEKGKEKKSKEKARSGEKGGGKDKAATAKNEKGSEKTSAAKDPAQKSKSPEPRQGAAKPSGAVSAGSEALR